MRVVDSGRSAQQPDGSDIRARLRSPVHREVSRLIWSGEVAGWNEGAHLSQAAARAGCDLAEMDAAIVREAARLDAVIEKNQSDLEAAGHWGVPTMVFEGEPFFGQDRVDLLVWRMQQHGLTERY